MNWFTRFFTSSIGQKLIMSLTGLFLIVFLVVHLSGNLQLLADDGGEAFNTYTYFMTHNPVILTISYLLYTFILLHAIQGIVIKLNNRGARSTRYEYNSNENKSFASRNMAQLGLLILVFLGIHMGDFWYSLKFGDVETIKYASFSEPVKDIYAQVESSFAIPWIVIVYVISMIGLGFHLWHGFESAFRTLGVRHSKYTPIIDTVGKIYSVAIPLGFAIIPLYYFFFKV